MAWDVTVAGTVTLDDVLTPHGRRTEQQGGSAVYAALAAAGLAPVHLVGVAGADGEESLRRTLDGAGVDLEGLERLDGRTFRWRATHDFTRWVAVDESADEGVLARWSPRLPAAAAAAPVLFLGSMRAGLQAQLRTQSAARLVGADSMTVHIGAATAAVHDVAESADVLFLNVAELSALTGASATDWAQAARALCGRGRLRAVVVKHGPLGAACVTVAGVLERAASRVDAVVDPTGAGDALAGGFLGTCAAAERDDAAMFPAALDAGMRCAAAAIAAFGPAALREHTLQRRRASGSRR